SKLGVRNCALTHPRVSELGTQQIYHQVPFSLRASTVTCALALSEPTTLALVLGSARTFNWPTATLAVRLALPGAALPPPGATGAPVAGSAPLLSGRSPSGRPASSW